MIVASVFVVVWPLESVTVTVGVNVPAVVSLIDSVPLPVPVAVWFPIVSFVCVMSPPYFALQLLSVTLAVEIPA